MYKWYGLAQQEFHPFSIVLERGVAKQKFKSHEDALNFLKEQGERVLSVVGTHMIHSPLLRFVVVTESVEVAGEKHDVVSACDFDLSDLLHRTRTLKL